MFIEKWEIYKFLVIGKLSDFYENCVTDPPLVRKAQFTYVSKDNSVSMLGKLCIILCNHYTYMTKYPYREGYEFEVN